MLYLFNNNLCRSKSALWLLTKTLGKKRGLGGSNIFESSEFVALGASGGKNGMIWRHLSQPNMDYKENIRLAPHSTSINSPTKAPSCHLESDFPLSGYAPSRRSGVASAQRRGQRRDLGRFPDREGASTRIVRL